MNKETWEYVDGTDLGYRVSKNGEVWSEPKRGNWFRGGTLKKTINQDGYHVVSIIKNRNKVQGKVHRLVAEAFIPNPENKPEVNHKNGVKTDNRIDNLEWATPKENGEHASVFGLLRPCKDEKHGGARKIGKYLDGKLLKEYACIKEVLKENFNYSGVRHALLRNNGTSGGFHWKYLDEKAA